ncbi:ABC transporter substrate-binding protein [Yinghuangia aomiensis]
MYGSQPIGAGPFVLKSWQRGSVQEFERNPNYWQKDKGLPKLDGISVKNVPDIQQQYTSVKSGQADIFVSQLGPEAALQGEERAERRRVQDRRRPDGAVQPGARRRSTTRGRGARSRWRSTRRRSPRRSTTGTSRPRATSTPPGPFVDQSVKQPAPNKDEAQKPFNDLAAEGKKVEFSYLVPQNPSSVKVAEFMLRPPAAAVPERDDARSSPWRSARTSRSTRSSGTSRRCCSSSGSSTRSRRCSTRSTPAAFLNFIGWKNADADKALLAGRMSTDPAARKQAYSDLQKAMAADLPIWVCWPSRRTVRSSAPRSRAWGGGGEQYNAGVFFMDRIGRK